MQKYKNKNLNINQAVIFAGGRGRRLYPITKDIPKPLASVCGYPFLDYLINSLIKSGIKKVLFLVGYKYEKIVNRYKYIKNINVEFSIGKTHDRTGKRLINAYNDLDKYFLLVYGDNYWPLNLNKMIKNYIELDTLITTTVFDNLNATGEYGIENNIYVNSDGKVINYDKKRALKSSNGVDIGYFMVSKDAIDKNINDNISFEESVLPKLISKKQLGAFITGHQYYYITDTLSLKNFELIVKKNKIKPLSSKYLK